MKLLLIQPSPYNRQGQPIRRSRLYFVGLALPLLAALTPEDWQVEMVLETIEDVPLDSDADLVGISSMGHGVHRTLDLAREFKKRGKTVVLGGYMVSLMPEEAQKHCDALVVGDAEGVWQDLLRDFQAGQLKPVYEKALTHLENLPLPRYDLLLKKKIGDFLPVQAGRGCPHSCSFCSVHCLYRGRYLRREIPQVVRDIRYIRSLGFKKFLLLDDNIAADESYLLHLAEAVAPLGMTWFSQCAITVAQNPRLLAAMARSGCRVLSFGLESISQASLDGMDKGWARAAEYPDLIQEIRRAGIEVSTEMVVGGDGDTLDSIARTADFIARNKIVVPRFYILTPIPGTDFHRQMAEADRLVNRDIFSYDGTAAVHQPLGMTAGQLTEAYWSLYRRVFSLPAVLARILLNRNFLRRPLTHLFYLLVNLAYRRDIQKGIPPNII